jgi:thioredoxin reductase (NADPH)
VVGGQAGTSPKIENYLGFSAGISGAELAEGAWEQADKFGAEMLFRRAGVRGEGIIDLSDGSQIVARSSICATGVEYRRLGLPNEERLQGAGVYYGAGAAGAALCRSTDHVYIVGGGNSAAQASLYFSTHAAQVTMVVRDDSLKKAVSQYLIDCIRSTPNIEIVLSTKVVALHGDTELRAIRLREKTIAKEWEAKTDGCFCASEAFHTRTGHQKLASFSMREATW